MHRERFFEARQCERQELVESLFGEFRSELLPDVSLVELALSSTCGLTPFAAITI